MDPDQASPALCARVPEREAARAFEVLGAAEAIDPRYAVASSQGHVHIPVRGGAGPDRFAWPLVTHPLAPNPKRAPADRLRDLLAEELPHDALDVLPTGWQLLGDVLVVKPDPRLAGHEARVFEVLAGLVGARSVLAYERTRGELREPATRLVWGDAHTETVHREAGIAFHLDPARVLFSQGNVHERHRLVNAVRDDEVVVDLFAGVGYFTLPLARAGARVVACEKNPVSAAYLRRNVEANGLDDRVDVREGDCRTIAPTGVADRVLLGYFPGTRAFLGSALRALGPDGGWLHYHTVADEPGALDAAERELLVNLPSGAKPRSVHARRVKSAAPRVTHVVLDVEVAR